MKKKAGCFLYGLTGFLFLFLVIPCRQLADSGNRIWTAPFTIALLIAGITLGSLIALLSGKGLNLCVSRGWFRKLNSESADFKMKEGIFFLLCLLLIFISWIPYLLSYFPGILAYDAVTQIGQIETGEYVEHHPLAHTLWIRFCLWLGATVFGSSNAGAALYSVLQMLALAAAFAYGLLVLRRYLVRKGILVVFLAFSMFYPFHGYLSISMTKDIYFTAFLLVQVLCLVQLLIPGETKGKAYRLDIGFVLSGVGMVLFRNNGKYALLVMELFLFFALVLGKKERKLWLRVFLDSLAVLFVGSILLSVLSASVHAAAADKREMLSMPIQQLARCMLYHGGEGILVLDDDTMGEEEKALIKEFLMEDGYKNYMPHISDPVKNRTLTSVVRYQPKRFATSYMKLLLAYPGDFINAALEVNAGYFNPEDESHSKIYQEMYPGMEGKGYVQTQWWESVVEKTGVHRDSKWSSLWKVLEHFADTNGYLSIPVLKYLFVPGIWFWWLLLLFARTVWSGKLRRCFPLIFLFGYFGTLILGPVVQLRYIYPIMVILPFLSVLYCKEGEGQED